MLLMNTMLKSDFLKIFKERGFFYQCTDEAGLDNLLCNHKVTAYIGFDCTAPSLHVGSLMQIMVLRWLKKLGHNPIILLGGATTKIGDPSGKDESRPSINDDIINTNLLEIKKVFEQFDLGELKIVNNNNWIGKLSLMDLIQIAEHFSINRMLSFDSVKLRIERQQEMTLKEFNYMVIQAYDFVELYKLHGCRLQIGGSDQWGNIVNGVELQRRLSKKSLLSAIEGVKGKETHDERIKQEEDFEKNQSLFGLTTPLITTSSGAKMGKTAKGAIWLSKELLSENDYWQFWRNTEDKDVGRFLRLFTDLPVQEIEKLEKFEGAEINQAKIILANEATKICHGGTAAKIAEESARKVFTQGSIGEGLHTITITDNELKAGIAAFKLLHMAGLAESGGDAKRLIKGGGARVNDIKIQDENEIINAQHLNNDGIIKLSVGKKKHALVKT